MTDNAQPEALRLADRLHHEQPTVLRIDAEHAGEELRRQHARIAELEAQLEAIGAGGVSGPLMGRTDSKERDAFERALMDLAAQHGETVSTKDLSRDASGTYDNGMTEITWMLWQARASLAASAGSEPVARVNGDGFIVEIGDLLLAPGQKLYLHPSPPEGMVGGWIALPGALPEPGTPVLLDIGKKYPIRAMWAAKHTLPVGLEDDAGFGEYDERTDEWYCPEGWYEWNEHEETNWAVSATPRAWALLPPTTSAGSGKGE